MDRRGNGTLIIDDLVILGRSSPDTMRDNRVSVCVAGYSRTIGFVRLYPTRLDSPLRAWNIVSVPVERNPKDARPESWKITGSKSEWARLSEKITVVGRLKREEKRPLVMPLASGCVLDLWEKGRSLGIVRPRSRDCYFTDREDQEPAIQMTLLGRALELDKHKYGLQPRVRYLCSNCRLPKGHDQQILEWGIYEWLRKNPGKEDGVWANLFWKENQQDIYFVVGNQAKWPSSFMVISVLRMPKT